MGYKCIFLIGSRCTASARHYIPDARHLKCYCHTLNCANCPVMMAWVTKPGVFQDGW